MKLSMASVLAALVCVAHAGQTFEVFAGKGCTGAKKQVEVNQDSCNPGIPSTLSFKAIRHTDTGTFIFWSDGDGAGCVGQQRYNGCGTTIKEGICHDLSGPAKAIYIYQDCQ